MNMQSIREIEKQQSTAPGKIELVGTLQRGEVLRLYSQGV